jgi:hypothetical protein
MLHNLDDDFESIAHTAWESQTTPLERMYDRWVGEGQWEPSPPQVKFRIYDRISGKPIPCHLCQSTDDWVLEGDESRRIARVFICEHEPILAGRAAVRQVSSVPVQRVGHFEQVSGPLE